MNFRKFFSGILLFLFIIILIGCGPNKYNIDANLYVQDYTNNKSTYIGINRKSFIIEKKQFNDDKTKKEIFDDLTKYFKSSHYKYNETKVIKNKNKIIYEFYFNLVDYNIIVTLQDGKTKEFKNKALQPFDFKNHELDENIIYIDKKSNRKIGPNSIVDDNMSLIAIGKATSKTNIELIEEVISLLNNTKYDKVLKNPIDYLKDSKNIDLNSYNSLKNALQEFLKVVNSKDENLIKIKLSDLQSSKTTFKKLIVVGTREMNSKDLFEYKVNLFTKSKNELKVFLSDKIIEDKLLSPEKYQLKTKHISNTEYLFLNDIYREAISLEPSIRYDEEDNDKNILLIEKVEELTNKIQAVIFATKVVIGTKEGKKLPYKVKITKDGQTIERQLFGYEGEIVNVEIPNDLEERYEISNQSKTSGVLKDENLVLELILIEKVFVININLNGGKIAGFDKKYLKVSYNQKINEEDILKLRSVTREKDLYAEKYEFLKYVDANTYEEFNLSMNITKDISILAIYTETKEKFNYKIELYKDIANSKTLEPTYSNQPESKYSNEEIEQGSFLYHIEEIPEGFELDEKYSQISFNRFTKEDVVLVYLKRKLHRINFFYDNDKAYFEDNRVKNNIATVKHGSIFDFSVGGIEAPKEDNKFIIFDKILDKETQSLYDTSKPIDKDLNLLLTTKKVDKRIKVVANYSYAGEYEEINNQNIYIEKHIYVEPGKRIIDVDKNFFRSDSYDQEAQFDLENNIGYVLNKDDFTEFNKNQVLSAINEEEVINLLFVYNLNKKQSINILLKELYLRKYADKFYRAIYGKLIDKHENNLFVIETEDQERFLINIQKKLSSEETNIFQLGNKVRITAPMLYNYNQYVSKLFSNDDAFAFEIGRYGDVVISYIEKSSIKLMLSDNNEINSFKIEKFDDKNYYKRVSIDSLIVTKKALVESNLEYYDSKNAPKYYVLGVKDPFNNNGYLMMQEKNINLKVFSEINEDDVLNVKNSLLIKGKANIFENQIEAIYESALDSKPTLLIDDFYNQIELKNEQKVKVTINTIFDKYIEFPEFQNLSYDIYLSRKHTLNSAISKALENKVFNGYRIKNIKSNNEIAQLESKVFEGQIIEVEYEKNDSYIEFILVSYIPYELKKQIYLEATTGGKKYVTHPVDIEGNFIKFILDYNGKDHFIDTKLNLGEQAPNNQFVISIAEEERKNQILRYVAYDGGRYSPIVGRKGSREKIKISYTWAAQHPFLIKENETGFFVDLFDIYKFDGSSDFFSKMHISKIFLVADGFKSADAEFHVNVEHNGKVGYGAFTGHNFYKIDGKFTTEQLNDNKDLKLFLKGNINYVEERKNGENTIDFQTDKIIEYLYHKDSLHKLVQIDPKYNIGIIHVNGDNTIKGKTPELDAEIFNLTAKQQKDDNYKLSKSNKIVFNNKKGFLNYLNDKNIDLNDVNTGKDKSFTNLSKYNITYNFEIKTPNYKFLDEKTSKQFFLYYLEDKIDFEELKININNNQEVLFMQEIDENNLLPFDMTYDFSNLDLVKNNITNRNIKINIYVVEKKNIEIRIIPTSTKLSNLRLGYSNNVLYSEKTGEIEKNYKKFNVDIKYSKDIIFSNNFIILDQNIEDKSHFSIPSNFELDENQVYYYVEKTNNVVKASKEDKIILFFNNLFNDVYLDGSKIKLKEFNNSTKYFVTPSISKTSIIEFKNLSNLIQKYELTEIEDNKINLVTFEDSKKTSINKIIETNENVLKVTIKNNLNLNIKTLYFYKSNKYNQLYLTLEKLEVENIENKILKLTRRNKFNKYYDYDIENQVPEEINYLDLKVFYFEKYDFGQTIKVYFDYDSMFTYAELDELLYNGYLLVEINNKIKMPDKLPKLNEEYQETKKFKGFAFKQEGIPNENLPLIDFDSFVVNDPNKNLEIILLSQGNKVKFYSRVYFSKLDNPNDYTEIVEYRKEYLSDPGEVIEFSLNGEPYGYNNIYGVKFNTSKSRLKVIIDEASNDNDIKLYYDGQVKNINLNLKGLTLLKEPEPSWGVVKAGRRYDEKYLFYKDFTFTGIYLILSNPNYRPAKFKGYSIEFTDHTGQVVKKVYNYVSGDIDYPNQKLYGDIKVELLK